MNKKELALLEKVFESEIDGGVYQRESKLLQSLHDRGYVIKISKTVGKDIFGSIVITGYVLTFQGNYAYCSSLREDGD